MYYPRSDDIPVALSLSSSSIGRFLIGEINGELVASVVANPAAEDIFTSSYGYVSENYRYDTGLFMFHVSNLKIFLKNSSHLIVLYKFEWCLVFLLMWSFHFRFTITQNSYIPQFVRYHLKTSHKSGKSHVDTCLFCIQCLHSRADLWITVQCVVHNRTLMRG